MEEEVRKRVSHEVCQSQLRASEHELHVVTKDAEALAASLERVTLELREQQLKYHLLKEEHQMFLEHRRQRIASKLQKTTRPVDADLTVQNATSPNNASVLIKERGESERPMACNDDHPHRQCEQKITSLQRELASEKKQRANLLNMLVENRKLRSDATIQIEPAQAPVFLHDLPIDKAVRAPTPPVLVEVDRDDEAHLDVAEERKLKRLLHRGFSRK